MLTISPTQISALTLCLLALLPACSSGRRGAPGPSPMPGTDGGTPPGFDGGGPPGPGVDGGPPGPGVDSGTPPGPTGMFECCISDVGYRCATEAAFNQCAGFDPRCFDSCTTPDCFDACIRMQAEAMPDPSACVADPAATCESSGTCVRGTACDYDADCPSNNCTGGYCYANDVGCACDYDADCTSNNCTLSECRGNGLGAACDYDADCSSNNCTSGECRGNGSGSPCDYDADCTSNNCTGGSCR